jgi:TetR/AcrR family transcriptional regulator, repressor of fatR-cypB operon
MYIHIVKATAKNFVFNYDVSMPVKAKIKSICRAYFENFIKNPGFSAFIEQFYRSNYFRSNPKFMEIRSEAYKPVFLIIQEGQAQGIIKDIDTNLITVATAGMMREVGKLFKMQDGELDEQRWEEVFSMVWDAMKS